MLIVGLLASGATAQTNVTSSKSANRWLFVVETSRSTERQADALRTLVPSLVFSGMDGQLRKGDTIGLWTFNSELHDGELPLQQWTPETRRAVAQRMGSFLETRKFERTSRLEPVLTSLEGVIRNSEFITVVLITSGQQKVEGTPFDEQINSSYDQWRRQQERARLPFS
jgi:hypothetical protein